MPAGLRRYYHQGHLHVVTFSCYRRLLLLKMARARDIFVQELGKVREGSWNSRIRHPGHPPMTCAERGRARMFPK
jgi:hypothetical protein